MKQKMVSLAVKRSKQALLDLAELLEAGRIKPVIDCVYELSDASQAMKYLEEGRARGKIVIKV